MSSYEMIVSKNKVDNAKPFSNVVGHEIQKRELLLILDWFKKSKELKEKGLSIPKGIILYGTPGNGKTLLIREIIKHCESPVILFHGEKENLVGSIAETFEKAREIGHTVIVFDELDLLINKDTRVTRVIQENLDGVESNDDILVLAATNDLSEIPYPLLRCGRLEKHICIPNPSGEDAVELFKRHFEEFNVKLPEDFDDEEIALSLCGTNFAKIKTIVNDIILRNGSTNITSKMIDDSIYIIMKGPLIPHKKSYYEAAIHESGHAVATMAFPQFFKVKGISIFGGEGAFSTKLIEEEYWPFEKVIANIKISMAGIIAERVIIGSGSLGSEEDLQKVRAQAYHMINLCGYSSCWETLPEIRSGSRTETNSKRRRMERKIEKLLKKCEKQTTNYIKKHKEQVIALAKLLYEKNHLKSSEILSVIG